MNQTGRQSFPSSSSPRSTIRVWLAAARPATLWAAVAPVIVGSAVAWRLGGFRWPVFVTTLFCSIALQVGTNFANDLFDFEKGADTQARVGPARAVAAGWVAPRAMLLATGLAFGAAVLAALLLLSFTGWPIVVIGLFSIVAGLAYTAGPWPLGYRGLGDVTVLTFFGFVAVVGTAWAHLLSVPELSWWCAVPVGSLATAILVVNNLRDRKTDALANKRTLAVRWGPRAARAEYGLLLTAAFVAVLGAAWRERSGLLLLPWLTMPLAIANWRALQRLEGVQLNELLGRTARLLLFFSVLLAVGLLIG